VAGHTAEVEQQADGEAHSLIQPTANQDDHHHQQQQQPQMATALPNPGSTAASNDQYWPPPPSLPAAGMATLPSGSAGGTGSSTDTAAGRATIDQIDQSMREMLQSFDAQRDRELAEVQHRVTAEALAPVVICLLRF